MKCSSSLDSSSLYVIFDFFPWITLSNDCIYLCCALCHALRFNYVGLPSAADFYSKLNRKHVKENEYIHACNVYKELQCKCFEDYHNIYLNLDC